MFQKSFSAGSTDITPFFQNKSNLFSKAENILYFLKAVVMAPFGFSVYNMDKFASSDEFRCEFVKKNPHGLLF